MQSTKSRPARGRNHRRAGNAIGRSDRPRNRRDNDRRPSRGRGRGNSGSKRVMSTFDPTQFINKNPVAPEKETYVPTHTFNDFAIDARLKKTLEALKLTTPSPIQDQIIPEILAGRDVVGLAETGTGKTAAFLVPLIELKKNNPKSTTLILAPTRELAIQVDAELKKLAKNFRYFSAVCVGGANIGQQIRQLRKPNQFIIGTPGRIKDLIERGKINTYIIDSVVLDEADRMLDMGFVHDMREILSGIPEDRHTMFFSATMDDKTKTLVHDFLIEPVTISVKKKDVTDSIAQDVVRYRGENKYETLVNLLRQDQFKRVIIFGAMKHSVEKLSKALCDDGIIAESIHGNKSQNQRERSLRKFKNGQAQVLVATDVAARGIHVDDVSHVINYDLPHSFSDYVHRIGRTGRGDKRGEALTFVQS